MSMKSYVWLGAGVGGTVGGLLGAWIDHGNGIGAWSLVLSTIGGLAGIWGGYKLYNN